MYHIMKTSSGYYIGPDGHVVNDRASALHIDVATFKAIKNGGGSAGDLRIVTVTTRADRAARHVDSTSDPQSAQ